MGEFSEFITAVSAGGDVGVMALLFVAWRLEKRMTALEFKFSSLENSFNRKGKK